MKITRIKYDYIIVGSGITGLALAVAALEHGCSVLLLEKDSRAFGASTQHTGLVAPVLEPSGPRLRRAMYTRDKWLELADPAGYWTSGTGVAIPAYHRSEMAVLEAHHATGLYQTTLLTAKKMAEKYPQLNSNGLVGGMVSDAEITLDSGKAVYAIANWLRTQEGCDLHCNELVLHAETGKVHTLDGVYEAEEVLICNGNDACTLFPEVFSQLALRTVKMQMIRTQPAAAFSLGPAWLNTLALSHYEPFPMYAAYREMAEYHATVYPEREKHGIHLILTQNREGELTLGGSMETGPGLDPFNRQDINQLIVGAARRVLKPATGPVKYVWNGMFTETADRSELVVSPCKGVTLVNGFGRDALTTCFGFARDFLQVYR